MQPHSGTSRLQGSGRRGHRRCRLTAASISPPRLFSLARHHQVDGAVLTVHTDAGSRHPRFEAMQPMPLFNWKAAQNSSVWGTIKGAGVVMAIRIIGAGLAFLSQVFLARVMGAYEFGLYIYAFMLLTVFSVLVPFGTDLAVLRFIPEYFVKKRWRRLEGVFRASIAFVGVMAVAIALVAAALIHVFSDRIGEHYVAPLYMVLVSLPLFALPQIYMNFARTFDWTALAYTPNFILRPALLIILVIGLVVVNVPPTATAVLVASLAASALAFAYQAITVHSRKPHVTQPAAPAYHVRAWLTVAFSMAMINGFELITTYGDVLILGNFVEPDKIGIYNAAVRTAGIINIVLMAVSATATPKYAELYAKHQHDELRSYVFDTARWIFWPSLLGGILLILGGKYILLAFGPAFIDGYPVLVILVLSNLGLAAAGNVDSLLIMTGQQRVCARVMVWTALAFIALNFTLIPLLGVIGAALAVWASLTFKFAWLVIVAKQRLAILALVTLSWPRLRPRAAT
jgi:O-antigen/teichoic acid export membrane protein